MVQLSQLASCHHLRLQDQQSIIQLAVCRYALSWIRTYDGDGLSGASDCDSYLRLAATASTAWSRAANRAITFLYAGRTGDRLDGDNFGECRCLRDRRGGRAIARFAGCLETAGRSALGCVDGLISCQSLMPLIDLILSHTWTLVSVAVWWMVVVTTVVDEPEPRV